MLLGGWTFGSDALRRVRPDFAAMVPTTALSFVLLGGVLCLRQARPETGTRLRRAAGLLVFTLALLNLAVSTVLHTSGLEGLVLSASGDYPNAGTATATAFCFLLASFCVMRPRPPEGREDLAFTIAATTGLVLACIALTGYAFDAAALYEVSLFTAMAVHTALAFAALFLALLLSVPDHGWIQVLAGDGGGSASARRLLPGTLILPFLLCLLALWATGLGAFSANFRLSVLAIVMIVLLSVAVLRSAFVQNRIEGDLHAALADRELLLREVYHRVKNNLQMTTALLRLGRDQTEDATAQRTIDATVQRVEALGIVHRLLLSARVPSEVDVQDFLRELCGNIAGAHAENGERPPIAVEAERGRLHVETTVTLGLLVNELVTNALKHAFPGTAAGEVRVGFSRKPGGEGVLLVADDGVGYEPGSGGGIGTQLIEGLVAQLDGQMDVRAEQGTRVLITIPSATFEDRTYDG
ncbi:sensor histidine kinase [Parvularcula oceani]|uniref:sensor histidine kinase n=1 Tax=Parvularcula oceani TaxID=1247963 RepID=UPI0006925078|nr:sensor histidine kinase [Parvularcula oceani]